MGDGHGATARARVPQARSGDRVGPVQDNGAGQDGDWRQRGLKATAALAETWGAWPTSPTSCRRPNGPCPPSARAGTSRTSSPTSSGSSAPSWASPSPAWDGPLGDHVKNDFAARNERWIAVRRPFPGPTVRDEFVEVTRGPAGPAGGAAARTSGRRSAGARSATCPTPTFMEVRVFDSWVHEQDARRALDRPGGDGNRASALSLDRVQGAMPFVVGKQAGCADGTAVRFDVAGPGGDARVLHRRRRGRTGPSGRRRGGPDGHAVALEHRLRAPRLRPGHGGTGGGRRWRRPAKATQWSAAPSSAP